MSIIFSEKARFLGTWVKENDPNDRFVINADGTCLYNGSLGTWDEKPAINENPSELIFTISGNKTVLWYYQISDDYHYLGLFPQSSNPIGNPSKLYVKQ